MDLEVASILITGCFWYWTTKDITITISPLREENRWHKRLANLTYTVLVALQIISLSIKLGPVGLWAVSLISAMTITYTLILSKFDREGFWAKPRNQTVGGLVLLFFGASIPLVVVNPTLVPLIFAIVLAHEFHKAQVKQFSESVQDLDSIKSKLTKLEADLKESRIEKAAMEPDNKIALLFNPRVSKPRPSNQQQNLS